MGADRGAGGDVKLHLSLGADHGADVAAIEDRAALAPGKAALEIDERRPHLGDHGDPAGRLPGPESAQVIALQIIVRQRSRGFDRIAALRSDRAVK